MGSFWDLSMPAPTLDGRLLCASGCTYGITSDGVLAADPTSVYYTDAGFLVPPTTFVGGIAKIDACLVGTTPDGVVLAFRGTLPFDIHSAPTLRDWLGDFNADPIDAEGYPGQVHAGFWQALAFLQDRVVAEVNRQRIGAPAALPLLITGHSKGGALAALAAWRFLAVDKIPTKVVTFAAAKSGDAAFRDAYDAQIDHTRYEFADDIVPHLPPSQGGFLDTLSALPVIGPRFDDLKRFDYEQVGVLRYIDASGRFVATTPRLPIERILSLVKEIVAGHFHQIAIDHAIGCGSGYMSAICPTGVCPATLVTMSPG
jgi:hypothetical protein